MTTMRAHRLLAGSIALLMLGAIACRGAPERPDLVIVTWDTVRADHVGPGEEPSVTPVLDGLAEEGAAFVEARTPVPITLPAHASLLTGLQPASHGVRENGFFRLDASVPTLADRAAAGGFATGAFVSAQVLEREAGLARSFETYDDAVEPHPYLELVPERRADRTVDAAIRWLEGVSSDRPVLLWVHLYDPHRAWVAPEPFAERHPDPYRAEIAFADAETGRLLGALDRLGRLPRSIVVVASDHGEGLGEHDEATHAYFAYDSTMRVPLVWWAGSGLPVGFSRGARLPGPASLVDVAPTLLELADLAPLDTDGRSLARHLVDGTPVAPRTLPLETVHAAYAYATAPIFGLLSTDGEVWFDLPRRERYDLGRDPGQRENLYTPADAEQADALFAAVPRAWPPESAARELDASDRAALEALGYVATPVLPTGAEASVDPKDRVALSNFLSADSELMTPTRALRESEALVARHGALPALARKRALMFDRLGLSRNAIEEFERSVRAYPGHALMQQELAQRREALARGAELAHAIRTALEREPDHPHARRDLALTLHRLQELPEAESLYEEILAADADDDATRLNLVGLLVAEGRAEEALACADMGRARPDHDPRLDCAAGRILAWHLQRRERAIAPMRSCREGGARLTPLDRALLEDATEG